jgi:hypothetical protein
MSQEAAHMTAIVLPDIDRSTIDELKKRIPDLSEIELSLPTRKELNKAAKDAGKTAKEVSKSTEDTIDRLLGRKRAPMWPWIAAGIGLAAVVGVIAAWFAWFRRPTWESQSEPWTATYETEQTTMTPLDTPLDDTESSLSEPAVTTKSSRSTAKSTPDATGSAPYPIEEA